MKARPDAPESTRVIRDLFFILAFMYMYRDDNTCFNPTCPTDIDSNGRHTAGIDLLTPPILASCLAPLRL